MGIDFINKLLLENLTGTQRAPWGFRLELETPLTDRQAEWVYSLLYHDLRLEATALLCWARYEQGLPVLFDFVYTGLRRATGPGNGPGVTLPDERTFHVDDLGSGFPAPRIHRLQSDTERTDGGPAWTPRSVPPSLLAVLRELARRLQNAEPQESPFDETLTSQIDLDAFDGESGGYTTH